MNTTDQIQASLRALRERAGKATPGPVAWQKFGKEYCLTGQYGMRPIILSSSRKMGLCVRDPKLDLLNPLTPDHPDAVFYAHARTDVPTLVDVVELAVKALEVCRADAHYMNLEWAKENKHEGLAMVINNIRKQTDQALTAIAERLQGKR